MPHACALTSGVMLPQFPPLLPLTRCWRWGCWSQRSERIGIDAAGVRSSAARRSCCTPRAAALAWKWSWRRSAGTSENSTTSSPDSLASRSRWKCTARAHSDHQRCASIPWRSIRSGCRAHRPLTLRSTHCSSCSAPQTASSAPGAPAAWTACCFKSDLTFRTRNRTTPGWR